MDIVSGLDIRVRQVLPKSDCDTRRFVLYGHVANMLQKSANDVNYIW